MKKLMLWAAVFCTLLVYVVAFELSPLEKAKSPEKKLVKVFNASPDRIEAVEISTEDRKITLMHKQNRWELTSPSPEAVNQENADSLVSSLVDLVNIEVVRTEISDLRQFGLEQPTATVRLFLEGKTAPLTLLIGTDTPTGVSMYAMVKGENEIIQVGTLLRFTINSFMDRYSRHQSS